MFKERVLPHLKDREIGRTEMVDLHDDMRAAVWELLGKSPKVLVIYQRRKTFTDVRIAHSRYDQVIAVLRGQPSEALRADAA